MGITTHNTLSIGNFFFSHEPPAAYTQYCFSGHIHPGVRVEGAARQSLRLPCFHIGNNNCTLPAFSRFTGLHIIKPVTGDRIFAVIENEILTIQAD
jgi:metallophosphoesterase superfamily enzyme